MANGLGADSQPPVGMVLKIPQVTTSSNASTTYQPYAQSLIANGGTSSCETTAQIVAASVEAVLNQQSAFAKTVQGLEDQDQQLADKDRKAYGLPASMSNAQVIMTADANLMRIRSGEEEKTELLQADTITGLLFEGPDGVDDPSGPWGTEDTAHSSSTTLYLPDLDSVDPKTSPGASPQALAGMVIVGNTIGTNGALGFVYQDGVQTFSMQGGSGPSTGAGVPGAFETVSYDSGDSNPDVPTPSAGQNILFPSGGQISNSLANAGHFVDVMETNPVAEQVNSIGNPSDRYDVDGKNSGSQGGPSSISSSQGSGAAEGAASPTSDQIETLPPVNVTGVFVEAPELGMALEKFSQPTVLYPTTVDAINEASSVGLPYTMTLDSGSSKYSHYGFLQNLLSGQAPGLQGVKTEFSSSEASALSVAFSAAAPTGDQDPLLSNVTSPAYLAVPYGSSLDDVHDAIVSAYGNFAEGAAVDDVMSQLQTAMGVVTAGQVVNLQGVQQIVDSQIQGAIASNPWVQYQANQVAALTTDSNGGISSGINYGFASFGGATTEAWGPEAGLIQAQDDLNDAVNVAYQGLVSQNDIPARGLTGQTLENLTNAMGMALTSFLPVGELFDVLGGGAKVSGLVPNATVDAAAGSTFTALPGYQILYRGTAEQPMQFLSDVAATRGVDASNAMIANAENEGSVSYLFENHAATSQGSPYISLSSSEEVAQFFARGPGGNQSGFVSVFQVPDNFAELNFENANPWEREYLAPTQIPDQYLIHQYQVMPKGTP